MVVLLALLTTVALSAKGQPAKVWRVGWLGHGTAATADQSVADLRQRLRDLGYVEGKNLVIETRYASGDAARLPELAMELQRAPVDIIVTSGEPAALAAKRATTSIPIVVTEIGFDPVKAGLVKSLARPEGNITGTTTLNEEMWAKRLGLLKQVAPAVARPAVLWNPANPGNASCVAEIKAAAPGLGMQPTFVEARDSGQLERALASIESAKPDALVTCWDSVTLANARRIAEFALTRRIPVLAPLREYADAGALISLGPKLRVERRRAADYVDKILKGAKPGSLPVEQASEFEMIPNLVTAKALGIVFGGQILLLADDAIQ
jgi:putative ABC transport system substrate-binding protein